MTDLKEILIWGAVYLATAAINSMFLIQALSQ